MALTNKERKELRDAGLVYYRRAQKWMTPKEIEEYEAAEEKAEQMALYIGYAAVFGILIFFLVMVSERGY